VDYEHTQWGNTGILVVVFLGVVTMVLIAAAAADEPGAAIFAGLLAAVVAVVALVFSRLTVTVAAGVVEAAFGAGWPRRVIEVSDIAAIRVVTNRWWYGWGIRLIPGGWMYNVWGLSAVELDLRSGKKFRIGTDEPQALIAALSHHTSLQPDQGP
jgi:hypothetical protein